MVPKLESDLKNFAVFSHQYKQPGCVCLSSAPPSPIMYIRASIFISPDQLSAPLTAANWPCLWLHEDAMHSSPASRSMVCDTFALTLSLTVILLDPHRQRGRRAHAGELH